jgi:hypothetical protein
MDVSPVSLGRCRDIKVKVKVKFTPEQATKALDGVRGQRHGPAALLPGKDPVPIV